jgi:hypothetical protein
MPGSLNLVSFREIVRVICDSNGGKRELNIRGSEFRGDGSETPDRDGFQAGTEPVGNDLA